MNRSQAAWKREAEKISLLQDTEVALREQLARSNDGKSGALKEKLAGVNAVNSELRARIKQLEDQVDKRDLLVKEWNTAIGGIDSEIRRLVEDNQQASKDQDLLRNELAEVN